jgi:hypothetical protein
MWLVPWSAPAPIDQGEYMNKMNFENLMDQGSTDLKSFAPGWLEEYKQRKMEREAEDTLQMEADDTLEMEI